ncbi:MAG TPA: polysaccharide biosynthesis/export family protein, partial [Planctomycetota bacterium]|nr:polysaccharide biosynthesis/export family protein [Planctomycetota bacterium]
MASTINATLEPDTVVLGVGDELALRFPYSETWNQEVVVMTDGSASFIAIGRLIVAGMSIGQLSETLSASYSRVFEDPKLDVLVTARGARMVYVMGEVREPGEFELAADGRLTLLDALARAGGPIKST